MKLINCDLGECLSSNPDNDIMPLIDMANIACGGHAGDETSMTTTLLLAKQHQVKVGAHPSYLDQPNFGRIHHELSSTQLFDVLSQQVFEFMALCQQHEMTMSYIKPHGALYHDMMHEPAVLDVVCQVLKHHDPTRSLVVQAGIEQQRFEQASKDFSIDFIYEAFADRGYRENKLIPRTEAGAVLLEPEQIVRQFHELSQTKTMRVDTVCFHSDNPASIRALQLLKSQ